MDINSVNITFGQANTKDWIDILSAMLTPLIAILGTYIAFQQWKISRTLEAFQVEQHKYDNYEVPIRELLKSYLEDLVSDNKNIDKKELTIQCINDLCDIFDRNHYMFDSDDDDLIKETCNKLREITQSIEPIKTMGLKKTCKVICDYYHYCCLLLIPLVRYMPQRDKSYINIFDILWFTLGSIIQFFIPHWVDRKFTRHVIPKIILEWIIFEVIRYFMRSHKENKKKEKEFKKTVKQLTLFNLKEYKNEQ